VYPWFTSSLSVAPFYGQGGATASWATTEMQSSQITSRGTPWGMIPGGIIAIVSGAGVAMAVTGGGVNALVGVAIAAALLPPIVNTGLCFLIGLWQLAQAYSIEGALFNGTTTVAVMNANTTQAITEKSFSDARRFLWCVAPERAVSCAVS
jgi:hypothetical protein